MRPAPLRRVFDLTLPLTPSSPGSADYPPDMRRLRKHDDPGVPFQLMWFGMTDHTGTHMDAPLHFIPGGKAIHELNVAELAQLPGICLDLRPGSPYQAIDAAMINRALEPFGEIEMGALIILHTGHDQYAGTPLYFDAPFITPDGMARLLELSPKVIGVNGPTVDDRRQMDRPIHVGLLSHEVLIIEGVANSEPLAGRRFTACALPLPLRDFTGSPIRLIAFAEELPTSVESPLSE